MRTPFAVDAGDLDGDLDADLAVANKGAGTVSILLNDGSGVFTAGATLIVGDAPRSLAIADLDQDSDLDIAVVNRVSSTVSILINTGGGQFAPAMDYLAGTDVRQLVVGELNGDAFPDIAVASHATSAVNILINRGSGTFPTIISPAISIGGSPEVLAIGDLNGDTRLDIAVASPAIPNGTVWLFENDGTASFGLLTTLTTSTDPAALCIADFDGNGLQDVAVVNRDTNVVSVHQNTGAGLFDSPIGFGVDPCPYYAVVGDFTGNGWLDVAAPSSFANRLSVLINQSAPLPADMNRDGLIDINDLSFFTGLLLDPAAGSLADRTSADVNADGVIDGRDIEPFVICVLSSGCP